jgi:CRP-like cAMP-binding protein
VSQLYQDALAREGPERGTFLDAACAGDSSMRREVDTLLALSAEASERFESDVMKLVAKLLVERFPAPSDPAASDSDNPYAGEALAVLSSKPSPLSDLSSDALKSLLSTMELREYGAGEHLIRQGDPGEHLLLILTGTAFARIHHAPAKGQPVGEFGPGDVVGEISLLTSEPRTADVISRTPVRALLLSTADFHAVARKHPEVRMVLTNVVADRLGRFTYDGLGGKDIHGYRIVRGIGRGGMGIVYKASRLATGEAVAMKMMNHRLLYQPGALQRFKREADTLKSLHHDSIARLYECFGAYNTQFLVMEFCEGSALNQLISRGPLEEKAVRNIIGQLAVALRYVHSHGLIHRDIKPSNVMLSRSGAVKLLDFGLAKFDPVLAVITDAESSEGGGLSRSFALLGTPRYMAPEQFAHGAADHRVDLYGLACVAYEALTGRVMVQASDLYGVIEEKLRFVLPPATAIGGGVTDEMHQFLARGLNHRPEKRTIDLDQLAAWAGPVQVESLPGQT